MQQRNLLKWNLNLVLVSPTCDVYAIKTLEYDEYERVTVRIMKEGWHFPCIITDNGSLRKEGWVLVTPEEVEDLLILRNL